MIDLLLCLTCLVRDLFSIERVLVHFEFYKDIFQINILNKLQLAHHIESR